MGVPFEALLPYGIMLGVGTLLPNCGRHGLTADGVDVRHYWWWTCETRPHEERWKARKMGN
jgi:hypothetical protein